VNEVRGRALGRTAARLLTAAVGLLCLGAAAGMFVPSAGMILEKAGWALYFAAMADTVVFLAWNTQARLAARLLQNASNLRMIRDGAHRRQVHEDRIRDSLGSGGLSAADPYAAMRQAVAAGTFSVNGTPYPSDRAVLSGTGNLTRLSGTGNVTRTSHTECRDQHGTLLKFETVTETAGPPGRAFCANCGREKHGAGYEPGTVYYCTGCGGGPVVSCG
jgi:hypothetical protein